MTHLFNDNFVILSIENFDNTYCHSIISFEQNQYETQLSFLWWKKDVEKILFTNEDINDFRLVCMFVFYQNQQFSNFCLSNKRCDTIDNLLIWIENFNRLKKKFRNLNQIRSTFIINWNDEWRFFNTIVSLNAFSIVECIDKEICAIFCSISFRNWIRATFEYTSNSIENLFADVSNLRNELKYRFTKFHESTNKYKLIKKVSNFAVILYRHAKNIVRNYNFDILWYIERYSMI